MSTRSRNSHHLISSLDVVLWAGRCDRFWIAPFVAILTSTAACKNPTAVDRGANFNSNDLLAEVRQGQFPQLQQPSAALLRACVVEKKDFCSTFPWSRENYNELAEGVDQRGELCRFFYVPEGSGAPLRNQQAGDGAKWTTVYGGGIVAALAPNTEGKHEWVEVAYRDTLGVSYGNGAENAPRAFVSRAEVTCIIPIGTGSKSASSKNQAGDAESPQRSTGSSQQDESSVRGSDTDETETTTVVPPPPPPPPPTKVCTINAPLHWKLNPFGSDIPCKPASGADLKLKSGEKVTIKKSPEPGSPTRYYEVNRKCVLTDEVIQHNTCVSSN